MIIRPRPRRSAARRRLWREPRGSQGMGVVSSSWLDRASLPILCRFKSSRRPIFRPPSLGPPLAPLKKATNTETIANAKEAQLAVEKATQGESLLSLSLYIYIYIYIMYVFAYLFICLY